MKLYVMRHGETDWNKERRLQGQADVPLNEFGRLLARETAKGMAAIDFDAVYSSPLVRARETAELVIGDRSLPVMVDERLQEMSFGPYEGLCCAESRWEVPDKDFIHFFTAPERYQPPEGGDTFRDVQERVALLIEEVGQMYPADSNILMVGHGVVVGAFLAIADQRELKDFWKDKVQKNCAVNILEIAKGGCRILEKGIIYYDEKVKDW